MAQESHLVLCVDDEEIGLKVRKILLERAGYRVLTAPNGSDGLDIFAREPIEAVVLDYSMPGMNGADVARAAQSKQSGLKVLIVSGYADSAAIDAAPNVARLLRKPFDLAELGGAVAEVLTAPA